MKKLLLSIILVLLSVSLFGQAQFYKGITVGKGGNVVTIDSIIKSSTFIKFYEDATELLAIDTATMLGHYIERKDTSNMLLPYAKKASPVFTGIVTIPTPFTLGAVSVTSTGTQLNYLSGTTGTTGTGNVVLSAAPTITGHPTIEGITPTGATGTGNMVFSASPTLSGTVALGSGSLTMTGSLAATGSRVLKGWFTDLEVTNLPTVGGATLKSALSLTSSDVGLGNVTNKAQVEVEDSLAMLAPYILDSEARTAIADTNAYNKTNAVVGLALRDSVTNIGGYPEYYATPTYVAGYVGSGGSGSFTGEIISFIVGTTTGAPTTADSIIIHSSFVSKHIDLYRDGALAYYNRGATANTTEGFRKTTTSDTIVVNPLWQDNEKVEIRIREPITWSYLSLSGQESDLLDSLIVYYKFEESGTNFDDAMDVQDASNPLGGTQRAMGIKFNFSRQIDRRGYIYLPYNALVNPDTIFSVSMWIWADSIGGANDFLFSTLASGGSVGNPQRAYINSGGELIFRTYNSSGSQYGSKSNITLSDSTLYHVCFVHRGNGKTNQIFVNGTDVTTNEIGITYTFSGNLYGSNGAIYFGNYTYSNTQNFRGRIDEVILYHKILRQTNVTNLYNLIAPLK